MNLNKVLEFRKSLKPGDTAYAIRHGQLVQLTYIRTRDMITFGDGDYAYIFADSSGEKRWFGGGSLKSNEEELRWIKEYLAEKKHNIFFKNAKDAARILIRMLKRDARFLRSRLTEVNCPAHQIIAELDAIKERQEQLAQHL